MSDLPTSAECYAIRRLNPFIGVSRIVQLGNTRAISNDATNWQIQMRFSESNTGEFRTVSQWTRNQPIVSPAKLPTNLPTNQTRVLESLVELLPACATSGDFRLADRFEFWALDQSQLPLALIASSVETPSLTSIQKTAWYASPASDIGFPSRALNDNPADHHPRYYAEIFEKQVNRHFARRRWIHRQDDGSGSLLCNAFTATSDRRHWSASAFPPYGVRDDWEDRVTRTLYEEWVNWTAPVLLTLDTIDPDERQHLEKQAVQRAMLVEQLHDLYPKIIQPSLINRARVEARLRMAV